MNHRSAVRFVTLALLTLGVVHCSSELGGQDDQADGAEGSVEQTAQASTVLPAHCYGKMLKPMPLELEQPIGVAMTIRVNRQCDAGAPLVNRKLRVYIRRYELGGIAEPQQLLMDWTDWPAAQYRFDLPWAAGDLLSGAKLPPGRYQIFTYALDASLYPGWVSGDTFARQMSTRSDNTYVELRDGGTWVASGWSGCSATCEGGWQTRTAACQDAHGSVLESRMCLDAAPDAVQMCNVQACPVTIAPNFISLDGWEDYGLVPSSSTTSGFKAIGTWQDPETVAKMVMTVYFTSKPTVAGEYAAASAAPGVSTKAYVTIARTVPGSGTVTYATTTANAKINVVVGSDNKLHAVVDDPAVFRSGTAESVSVKADITITP